MRSEGKKTLKEIEETIEQSLNRALQKNKPVVARCYRLSHEANKRMDYIIRRSLEYKGFSDLAAVVYSVTKEFMVNGLKANTKRILFDKNRLNLFDQGEYERGMAKFKRQLSPEHIPEYLPLLKANGLYAQFQLFFDPQKRGVEIHISNNVLMTKFEADKIQQKFQSLAEYDSIGDFFAAQIDEQEGAGLGFLMVMQMLESLPCSGKIEVWANELETRVRIIIPFVEGFAATSSPRELSGYRNLI